MIRLLAVVILLAGPALGETVVPVRTISAGQLIAADDLVLRDVVVEGALSDPAAIIGMEARVALYAGRPIRAAEIGPAAVIDRNQIITLIYAESGIQITVEGRALERAGPGDLLRVMNTASRNTVTARAGPDGAAYVSP